MFEEQGIRRRIEGWRRRTANLLVSSEYTEKSGSRTYSLTNGEEVGHGEAVVAQIYNPGDDKIVFSAVLVADCL